MIENIRKYTGLMIVILALLFVGLVFFGAEVGSGASALAGDSVMQIGGKSISTKEYQRQAINSQRIPSFFSPYSEGGAALNRANYILGAGNPEDPIATSRYLANRYAARQAGLDYCVTPNLDEVQRYIREVLFANADGSFDQKLYDDFIVNQLGQLGMNSRDFNEVLTDLLTANNLLDLIGTGLSPDLEITRALYEDSAQTVSVEQIVLPRAQYSADIKPSEEEIRAYWEKNKSKYLTSEQRKVTYILAEPDWDLALKEVQKTAAEEADNAVSSENLDTKAQDQTIIEEEEEEEDIEEVADFLPGSAPAQVTPETEKTDETPVAEPITETTEKPAAPANEELPAEPAPPVSTDAKSQLSPDQRIEAVKTLNSVIDEFWQTIYDVQGANFEEIAKDFNFEPITTEMFTMENAPDILKSTIDGERGGTVVQRIFRTNPKGSLEDRMSDVFRTHEGFIIFRLDGSIPAEELSYEDAKELVIVDLKIELTTKAMQEDAKAKHAALKEALDSGKSLADAAKELELTVSTVDNLTQPPSQFGYRPPAPPSFDLAHRLAPGELSELKALPNDEEPLSMMMVVLKEREIVVDEVYQAGLDDLYQQYQQSYEIMAFQNWLNEQYLKNNVRITNEPR